MKRYGLWLCAKRGILGLLLILGLFVSVFSQSVVTVLILKTTAAGHVVNPSLVALRKNNILYLPFEYLTEDLKLDFAFNETTLQLKGWVEKEDNTVYVNFQKNYGYLKNKKLTMTGQDLLIYEGQMFINSKLIDQMIGTKSTFDPYGQLLTVQTSGNLPFEKEKQRAYSHKGFDSRKSRALSDASFVYTQQDWFQMPFLDLSARYSFSKNEDGDLSRVFGYSANASFLTGGFDSEVNAFTSTDKEPPVISLTTKKIDEQGHILGLFKQLTLGDTYAFSNVESNSSPNGYGIKLSTDSALQAESRTYTFRDTLPLGWEVELYRNSELLGYQRDSIDGFFEFKDIPLLLGKNIFKFVFYGPQGQIKQKEEIVFFNGNILRKGKTRVVLNALNKNRYLVELRDKPRESSLGHNVSAQLGYGIMDNLTFNVSGIADSLELPERKNSARLTRKDKNFAAADLSLFTLGILTSIGTVFDFEEKANTLNFYTQTTLLDWDIIFENIYFGDAIMQRNLVNSTYIKNDTNLRLNHTFSLGSWLGQFPFSYWARYFTARDGKEQTEQNFSLSKNLPWNSYVNVAYQDMRWLSGGKTQRGSTTANHVHGPWTVRAGASYDFAYHRLYNITASAYRTLGKRLRAGVKYGYIARSPAMHYYENTYATNLSYQTKLGFISLEAGTSNRHNSYAFIGYNLSLLPDLHNHSVYSNSSRLNGTGALSALSFVDLNNNGSREPEEPVLSEATVVTNPQTSVLDSKRHISNGATVLTHLPTYKPIEVSVRTDKVTQTLSLINPNGTKTVSLRPAQVMHLEIPIIGTGDIEGTVYQQRGKQRVPARGILIRLFDSSGKLVATKVSEYDGYYIFTQVPLGNYHVLLDKDQGKELALKQMQSVHVHMNKFEQVEIRDIVLSSSVEQAHALVPKQKEKSANTY